AELLPRGGRGAIRYDVEILIDVGRRAVLDRREHHSDADALRNWCTGFVTALREVDRGSGKRSVLLVGTVLMTHHRFRRDRCAVGRSSGRDRQRLAIAGGEDALDITACQRYAICRSDSKGHRDRTRR